MGSQAKDTGKAADARATTCNLELTIAGAGTVSLDPPGGSYAPGTGVLVSATPNPDSSFTGWGGALSGTANPAMLTITNNTAIEASFK